QFKCSQLSSGHYSRKLPLFHDLYEVHKLSFLKSLGGGDACPRTFIIASNILTVLPAINTTEDVLNLGADMNCDWASAGSSILAGFGILHLVPDPAKHSKGRFSEYLIKSWLMLHKTCFKNLLEDRLTCSAERREGILNNKLSHLACFSGGMIATSAEVIHTCCQANSCSSLGPNSGIEAMATRLNERFWVYYILLPGMTESYICMCRVTCDTQVEHLSDLCDPARCQESHGEC
uniref:Uncharacterized protein n=1 Tax=Chrysemys picta bellii TaxID=8478 RepID=A0A8C3IVI3_CHRPI